MSTEQADDGLAGAPVWRWPAAGGFLFLCVRGLLLWIVVPVASVVWVLGWPFWRRRQVAFAQMLGWADLNLAAALMRVPFGPLVQNPLPWCPMDEAGAVTHRVAFTDPF